MDDPVDDPVLDDHSRLGMNAPKGRVEPSTEMGKASKGDGADCVRAARIPYIMLIQRAHPRPSVHAAP